MTEDLLVTKADGIVTATFNRPRSRNALTFAMYDGLADLCAAVDADESVKVLVLTGAGTEAFAAGTDITQFVDFETEAQALAYEARIERALAALERCRVPTIAAISGACAGGGAIMACCCDIRIGARNMTFGIPIARTLGNCLSSANLARAVALVGEARVKEMIFTGRRYDAADVLSLGLVSEIVEAADLMTAAYAWAARIAASAPLTVRSTKEGLARLRLSSTPNDDLLLRCYMSRDFHEAVAAFVARRDPRWEGR